MKHFIKFALIILAAPNLFAQSLCSDLAKKVWSMPPSVLETDYLDKNCPAPCEAPTYMSSNPDKLSDAQIHAVNSYTMGTHVGINLGLRTDNLNIDQLKFTRILDLALEKIQNVKAVVYRGTSQREFTVTGQANQIVTLPAFTSTAPTQEVAEAFLKNRLQIMKIKSGKNIQPYSNAGGEKELLIPRNTKFKIDRSEKKMMDLFSEESGPYQAEVEIVHMTEI
jgi:ADP-ribosyltransferase exoenzyme